MPILRELCESASNRATRQIGRRWGEAFPMYFLCEYPKSGGTWLGQMLADCLQVPFPKRPAAPIAMPALVHAHWRYDPKLKRSVYMVRDGRDVMVSLYFHFVRHVQLQSRSRDVALARRLRRLFGQEADLNNTVENLPRFIPHVFARPVGARVNWATHVESWWGKPGVVQTRYEDLLADTREELARTLRALTGESPADWRVDLAVEKYSMRRQTGRAPGQENRSSFIRKGVAGDWVNHFSREAREVFADLAGEPLIALGYEADRSWIDRPMPTPEAAPGERNSPRPEVVSSIRPRPRISAAS